MRKKIFSITDLVAMLGISKSKLWGMRYTDKMPKPFKVGGSLRWKSSDIRRWIELECPDCETFERLK